MEQRKKYKRKKRETPKKSLYFSRVYDRIQAADFKEVIDMNALQIILNICLILISLVLIVSVLMQSSESDGMGALSGNNDSFFGKAKNAALEAKLALATKVSAVVFVVLSIVMILVG